jgi:hypothetical protein
MKKIIQFLVVAMSFVACSKNAPENGGDAALTGKWNLEMVRADPGDGSGTYQPIESNRVIEFKADGAFSDPARPQFNRYSRQDDVITLTSTFTSETYHFYIEELNSMSLAFSLEGFWCGSPYGEKFIRINH